VQQPNELLLVRHGSRKLREPSKKFKDNERNRRMNETAADDAILTVGDTTGQLDGETKVSVFEQSSIIDKEPANDKPDDETVDVNQPHKTEDAEFTTVKVCSCVLKKIFVNERNLAIN
jgi:hypothetical protein